MSTERAIASILVALSVLSGACAPTQFRAPTDVPITLEEAEAYAALVSACDVHRPSLAHIAYSAYEESRRYASSAWTMRCIASGAGCDALADCGVPPARWSEGCILGTHVCRDGVAINCGETFVPDDPGRLYARDCGSAGLPCSVDAYGADCGAPCTAAPRCFADGRGGEYCWGRLRSAECATGFACDPSSAVCIGDGASCRSPSGWCEGDVLHICERLSDRENAPMDCAESGRRCGELPGSGHFCLVPPGAACEPLSFASTCTDGIIEYCRADGTLHRVDCRAYGLSGCTTNFRSEAFCVE